MTLFSSSSFQALLLSINIGSFLSVTYLSVFLVGLSCVGMPRQVTAFTCGYFFEFGIGVTCATVIVTFSAFLTYKVASLFNNSYFVSKFEKQLTTLHDFLSVKTFSKAVIIRLLPVGSNFLTNILAGIANIPLSPFLAGSCLGFLPQMMIFSLVGSGVKLSNSIHILVAMVLFFIAILLGYKLHKQHQSNLT